MITIKIMQTDTTTPNNRLVSLYAGQDTLRISRFTPSKKALGPRFDLGRGKDDLEVCSDIYSFARLFCLGEPKGYLFRRQKLARYSVDFNLLHPVGRFEVDCVAFNVTIKGSTHRRL
jgi:hypothetical protein